MKVCPNCQTKYPDDGNFCPQEACATPEGPRRLAPVIALATELGLDLPADHILGVLDDYVSRSGHAIAPVVVWLDGAQALSPNPDEVASVHRFRLDHIAREESVEFVAIPESDRPVIRVRIGERHVHAPTGALIYQLRELVVGRITRVAHFEQPVFAWR